MLNKKLLAAAVAACVAGASHAADTLNFTGTADDDFSACLSATLDWAGCGPTFATGSDWETAVNASTPVTGAGYLLVKAENSITGGGPAMFVANLSLTGGGFQFANGTPVINTSDTANWSASSSSTFAGAVAPTNVASGYAGATPNNWAFGLGDAWGASKYVWLGTDFGTTPVYFATQINAVTAVPEPQSYALAFAGLAIMGLLARRRRES